MRRDSIRAMGDSMAACLGLLLTAASAAAQEGAAYAVENGGVVKYGFQDGSRTRMLEATARSLDLEVEASGAHAYVVEDAGRGSRSIARGRRDFEISRIDLRTGAIELLLELQFGERTWLDLDLEPVNGQGNERTLYVLVGGARASAEIRSYDLTSRQLVATRALSALPSSTLVWGFAVNPTETAFYLNTSTGVYRVDLATGATSLVSSAWTTPHFSEFFGFNTGGNDERQPIAVDSTESFIYQQSRRELIQLEASTGSVVNPNFVTDWPGSWFFGPYLRWALSPDDRTILSLNAQNGYSGKWDAMTGAFLGLFVVSAREAAVAFGADPTTCFIQQQTDGFGPPTVAMDLSTFAFSAIGDQIIADLIEVDATKGVAYLAAGRGIVELDLGSRAVRRITADVGRSLQAMALSADRQHLLIGGASTETRYHVSEVDIVSGAVVLLGYGPEYRAFPQVQSILASRDGSFAYVVANDGLRYPGVDSGRIDRIALGPPLDPVTIRILPHESGSGASLSPDGSTIAIPGAGGIGGFTTEIALVDGSSGLSSSISTAPSVPQELAFRADGGSVVFCSRPMFPDAELRWSSLDLGTGSLQQLSPPIVGDVSDFAYLNTADGANVATTPVDSTTGTSPATVTFAQVDTAGDTTLTSSTTGPAVPSGFQLLGIYYDLATTATFTGAAEVCLHYVEDPAWASTPTDEEATLQLLHYENNKWVNITTTRDPVNDVICGATKSFSPFAVVSFPAMGLLSDLVTRVENLDLKHGIEASLDAKLDAAEAALAEMNSGRAASAVNALNAFIAECAAQRKKAIPEATADALIADAQRIVDELQ